MNNSNDTVDRVLAGLRDIEAPEGMDHRILIAIEDRAAAYSEPRRALVPFTSQFWLAATASAAITAIAIWWSASTHPSPTPTPATATATHAPATATPGTAEPDPVTAPGPLANAAAAREAVISTKAAEPRRGETRFSTPAAGASAPLDAAHDPAADSALADTLAASHPAPPLPLTEQEQLLIRILHKGDPVELASLNNDFRGRQTIEDTEAFQRFFKQQPSPAHNAEEQKNTGDQPTNDDQQTIEAQPTADAPTNDIPQQ